MEEKGKVISQRGNVAEISVVRVSACGDNCASCGGNCNLSEVRVNAISEFDLSPGDIVTMEATSKSMLMSIGIAYLLPLVLLVTGAIGGAEVLKNYGVKAYEVGGFGIGVVFLVISFFLIRFLGNRMTDNKVLFEVTRIEKKFSNFS